MKLWYVGAMMVTLCGCLPSAQLSQTGSDSSGGSNSNNCSGGNCCSGSNCGSQGNGDWEGYGNLSVSGPTTLTQGACGTYTVSILKASGSGLQPANSDVSVGINSNLSLPGLAPNPIASNLPSGVQLFSDANCATPLANSSNNSLTISSGSSQKTFSAMSPAGYSFTLNFYSPCSAMSGPGTADCVGGGNSNWAVNVTPTATSLVSTVVGAAAPGAPGSSNEIGIPSVVASDESGNVYIYDSLYQVIWFYDATSHTTTLLAGGGEGSNGGNDGNGTQARFNNVNAMVFVQAPVGSTTASDVLYIADGNTIRTLTHLTSASPKVTTIQGSQNPSSSSQLSSVSALAFDSTSRILYVGDPNNDVIWSMDTTSGSYALSPLVYPATRGSSPNPFPSPSASPTSITIQAMAVVTSASSQRYLYVLDTKANDAYTTSSAPLWKYDLTGGTGATPTLTSVGSGFCHGDSNYAGSVTNILAAPAGTDLLYYACNYSLDCGSGDCRSAGASIESITPDSTYGSPIAIASGGFGSSDGIGSYTIELAAVGGLAYDTTNSRLIVSDTIAGNVRAISMTAIPSQTLTGPAEKLAVTPTSESAFSATTFDGIGAMTYANVNGVPTVFAVEPLSGYGHAIPIVPSPSPSASPMVGSGQGFQGVTALASDGTNLYWSNVTALNGGSNSVHQGIFNMGGNAYPTSTLSLPVEVPPGGLWLAQAAGSTTTGTLYLTSYGYETGINYGVYTVTLTEGTGTLAGVVALAGTATQGTIDGPNGAATFNLPGAIVELGGMLYVTDRTSSQHGLIRQVDPTGTLNVTTVAGQGCASTQQNAVVDGAAKTEACISPVHLATDGTYIYFSEPENDVIRRYDPNGASGSGTISTILGIPHLGFDLDGPMGTAFTRSPGSLFSDGTHLYFANPFNVRVFTP